jgi:phosphoserine aminotransferase
MALACPLSKLHTRSKDYEAVHNDAQKLLRTLMNIPDDYQIIFLGGGASLQFCMVPMNFIPAGRSADYVITGAWAKKAYKEAALVAKAHIVASSEADHYT